MYGQKEYNHEQDPTAWNFLQAFLKINYIRSLQWPLIQKQERKWWSIRLSMGITRCM